MTESGNGGAAMQGKVCVITGGTSGIGQVAAQALARLGARIVLVARSRARARATLAQLHACNPGVAHDAHYGDLSRIADIKRLGEAVAAAEPRIDVLINNAGALFSRREVTDDGLERTFALNHVAYFVLTDCLRERLYAAAPARVVNTASAAHQRGRLDLDDLQFTRGYNGVFAYDRSKLCNILFTRELARRWADKGVTVNCLHPGFVATRLADDSGGFITLAMKVAKLFGRSPEHGAETIVYLASSPDVGNTTGGYFFDCRQVAPSDRAQDDVAAGRLWTETARLTGLQLPGDATAGCC